MPALFIISAFSWIHTVYRVSAFEGVGIDPHGVTWGYCSGVDSKTVGFNPAPPAIQTLHLHSLRCSAVHQMNELLGYYAPPLIGGGIKR